MYFGVCHLEGSVHLSAYSYKFKGLLLVPLGDATEQSRHLEHEFAPCQIIFDAQCHRHCELTEQPSRTMGEIPWLLVTREPIDTRKARARHAVKDQTTSCEEICNSCLTCASPWWIRSDRTHRRLRTCSQAAQETRSTTEIFAVPRNLRHPCQKRCNTQLWEIAIEMFTCKGLCVTQTRLGRGRN